MFAQESMTWAGGWRISAPCGPGWCHSAGLASAGVAGTVGADWASWFPFVFWIFQWPSLTSWPLPPAGKSNTFMWHLASQGEGRSWQASWAQAQNCTAFLPVPPPIPFQGRGLCACSWGRIVRGHPTWHSTTWTVGEEKRVSGMGGVSWEEESTSKGEESTDKRPGVP